MSFCLRKEWIQLFAVILGVTCGLAMGAEGLHASSHSDHKKHTHSITKVPYTIDKPGVYKVARDLKMHDKQGIVIKSHDVYLDLQNHTIDMNGTVGTAIMVKRNNVQIVNGTITNSGTPKVQQNAPDINPDISSATTPMQAFDIFLAATQAQGIQNPLGLYDPFGGVGIGLKGNVSDISIQNCQFRKTFVGIAADKPVFNVTINDCQAYDGGHNFGTDIGNDGQRGGFIILFNPNTDLDAPEKSEGIHISNCIGNSVNWQFGIGLYSATNSSITNTKMRAGSDTGEGGNEINCHGLFFCDNVIESGCDAWGGSDGFQHNFCTNGTILNCNATKFTDQGFDCDLTQFYVIDGCTASDLQFNTSVIPLTVNKGWGISAAFSTGVTVQNCVSTNNVKAFVTETEGVGIVLFAENSVVKNNICYGNNVGIALAGSINCQVDNNICNGNNFFGIAEENLPWPSSGNQYFRNEAMDNGVFDFSPAAPPFNAIPFVVSTSAEGPYATISPWDNLAP